MSAAINRGASTPHLRQRLEAAIEAAIALLDRLDGDPDFELDATPHPFVAPFVLDQTQDDRGFQW